MFQDTFQWSGTTSKKKGQKWGKERTSSFHKQDGYGQSSQDRPTAHNVGIKLTYDAVVDFEKLTPYTDLPKVFILFSFSQVCPCDTSHTA